MLSVFNANVAFFCYGGFGRGNQKCYQNNWACGRGFSVCKIISDTGEIFNEKSVQLPKNCMRRVGECSAIIRFRFQKVEIKSVTKNSGSNGG